MLFSFLSHTSQVETHIMDQEHRCSHDDLELHYEPQRKQFHIPLYINPAATDSERLLEFRGYNNRHTVRSLSDLNPDDCRAFCWKDCVIYGNAGLTGQDSFDLLSQVYQEWFPHRARDKNVSDGSFFGKFMQFKRGVSKLEEILCFHRSLCRRLQRLEADVPDRELYAPFHVKPDGVRRDRSFQLRPTFLSVLIVLNKGWQEHGVLLVCNTESTARELDVEGSKDGITSYEVTDGSDLGEARVFHCPLKRAMKIVVSRDKERARKRTEYNEMFDEIYGSEDEV